MALDPMMRSGAIVIAALASYTNGYRSSPRGGHGRVAAYCGRLRRGLPQLLQQSS